MKILFDHGVPEGLRRRLREHDIDTATERHWDKLENGALLDQAEANGYELFLTNDKEIPREHDLGARTIRVVVLERNNWPLVRSHVPAIREAIAQSQPGSHVMAEVPLPERHPKKRHYPVKDVQISYYPA